MTGTSGPTVADLMSAPVVTAVPDESVAAAAERMRQRRVGSVVVVDDDKPVGILTERDVVFAANWVVSDPNLRMREVMSKPVLAVSGATSLTEAYQIFRDQKIRHLVVLGAEALRALRRDLIVAMYRLAKSEFPRLAVRMADFDGQAYAGAEPISTMPIPAKKPPATSSALRSRSGTASDSDSLAIISRLGWALPFST